MSSRPPLPIFSRNEKLVLHDENETAIETGDILKNTQADERLLVLSIEEFGIIYYSTFENDYGYLPEEYLIEDLDGVGNEGVPKYEVENSESNSQSILVQHGHIVFDDITKSAFKDLVKETLSQSEFIEVVTEDQEGEGPPIICEVTEVAPPESQSLE